MGAPGAVGGLFPGAARTVGRWLGLDGGGQGRDQEGSATPQQGNDKGGGLFGGLKSGVMSAMGQGGEMESTQTEQQQQGNAMPSLSKTMQSHDMMMTPIRNLRG